MIGSLLAGVNIFVAGNGKIIKLLLIALLVDALQHQHKVIILSSLVVSDEEGELSI